MAKSLALASEGLFVAGLQPFGVLDERLQL